MDWQEIERRLLAVEDAINEPPKMWADEPLEVREYRHHLYRIWSPLCAAIIAARPTADRTD